ncbi:MAG: outer membrane protein assembly factor BamD [Candidatus Zapsychrus exili]|nr:outer membrane protein assembly factor BamD [Candidatus Zapsychrus exili]
MKRTFNIRIFLIILFILLLSIDAYAFWMWTPETNKWVNPKYAVKDTPQEQLEYSLEFYKVKEYEDASRELKKLLKHYPRARQAPEAQYYLGMVFEGQSKPYLAFKEYQMVIDKYPFSDLSSEIIKKQYDLGIALLEGEFAHGAFFNVFADDHDVIDIFRAVIKNAPYGDLASTSQYKIGLYLQEKGLYQESRDEFEKVINDYPDSEWAKAAKYQIAKSDAERSAAAPYDQKITQAAVEGFEDFLKDNPDAELSKDAKEKIGQLREKEAENSFITANFYAKQSNYKAAKIYYRVVIDEYPDSKWAKEALKKIQEVGEKE